MLTGFTIRSGPKLADVRSDIADSWHRANIAGLHPGISLNPTIKDVDKKGRLAVAARPMLDELAHNLDADDFGLLLADENGTIVERRFGSRTLAHGADDLGAIEGADFTEDTTGTNALATPLETRKPIFVNGTEHYLESMRHLSCFGMPIFHPVTRRLEGVVDLMAPLNQASPLMKPTLHRLVGDIQERLMRGYSGPQLALMTAFRKACENAVKPVIAFDSDVVYANSFASDLLDSEDLTLLKEVCRTQDTKNTGTFRLSSGASVEFRISHFGGANRSLLSLKVSNAEAGAAATVPRSAPPQHRLDAALTRARNGTGHVWIEGERGSGRTFYAHTVAGPSSSSIYDISSVGPDPRSWLRRLKASGDTGSMVIVENVELASPQINRGLSAILRKTPVRMVLTSTIVGSQDADQRYLRSLCAEVVRIEPLRERRSELGAITRALLQRQGEADRRIAAEVLATLAAQDWPGNVSEFARVLNEAVLNCRGDIRLSDVPLEYRSTRSVRTLSPLEQAERQAVVDTLKQCQGNKVHAAWELGISRSTLYARLRVLGISNVTA